MVDFIVEVGMLLFIFFRFFDSLGLINVLIFIKYLDLYDI